MRLARADRLLALPRRIENTLDGKWACGKQLDKFRGLNIVFASLWSKVPQGHKVKGRQCILLYLDIVIFKYIEKLHIKKKERLVS